jgi:ribonuclease T1
MRRGALGFIRGRDELDVIRVRLLLALLAALLGSLVVSSVVHADACTYDVSQLARVEFHVPGSNGSHRVGGASATQPESSSGAAERTIPLVATFVATNTAAPPRFVSSKSGIIDTESPALTRQIDDVADSIGTTGSPPPGVRQGGLPGKPGIYGNKSGALPPQPESYYIESDVWPGPGPRGTERVVVGSNGEVWYTPDHYGTFREIR